VSDPPRPERPAVVTGFPGERLYIHSVHPSLCKGSDSDACKPTRYVLTGDSITVAERCGNWTFMSYAGKRSKTSGWVAARYDSSPDGGRGLQAESVKQGAPLIPACHEAERILNEWLNSSDPGSSMLPPAITNSANVKKWPDGMDNGPSGPNVWSMVVGDARIADKSIKAISYSSGGTCWDQSMELWDPDHRKAIEIPTSEIDETTNEPKDPGDGGGYSSEDLVTLLGATYFAHITRSATNVKLYGFHSDLSAASVCEVTRIPATREFVKNASDHVLCDAVLRGKVEDGGLIDRDPVDLPDESTQASTGGVQLNRPVTLVAQGMADPGNDGKLHAVGIVEYHDDSGAGCGHEYNSEWPVLLGSDGLPIGSPVNKIAYEHAGGDNRARLFRFRGMTYFETRSLENADGTPTHEVWQFAESGANRVCSFNQARYEARPVPNP